MARRHAPRFAMAFVVAALGCQERRPPERPAKVPNAAVWAGGQDGGSWIHCSRDEPARAYDCAVYSDVTGDIEAKGKYSFQGPRSGPSAPLRFTGFDGETILLMDGRLEPVREE